MFLSKCLSSLCTVGITFISIQDGEPSTMTRCPPSIEPGITVTVQIFKQDYL